MSEIKYSLLKNGSHYVVGASDMRGYLHRPMYAAGCTFLLCVGGCAIVTINFRRHAIRKGDSLFLFSDMVFVIERCSKDFSVLYSAVSVELQNEANYTVAWDFYEQLYISPVFRTNPDQYAQLFQWHGQLSWFLKNGGESQCYPYVRNSFQNLFLGVDSYIKNHPELSSTAARKDRAWVLISQFFELLVANSKSERSVGFYANAMCITPYYLYKVTYKVLKMSPKALIDEQIVVEIKMHLSCTNMSIKEIAEVLNFEDASYMCRFFRRHAGCSLSFYRSEFVYGG